MLKLSKIAFILATVIGASAPQLAQAERIKELASIQGVRNNQLMGYGIVVGLDSTGDQTTQTPFTTQSVGNMLAQLGVNLPPDQASKLQLKNVAAVMLTATLPSFAKPGQSIDVTASSLGNAKSLRGGTLLMSPLKGSDGQVYAIAQGNILVGGVGASGGGAKVSVNHLSAGRIPNGATVERSVNSNMVQGDMVFYELHETDFGTASKIVKAINAKNGEGTAEALDGRRIAVKVPLNSNQRVSFLGEIEEINIEQNTKTAKVIINPRTGSVVMNQSIKLEPCAVAHGNLSVVITEQPAGGTDIQVQQGGGTIMSVKESTNLADVVKSLNSLGANPLDLLAILQALKSAGALKAELEVI
jgi:flagellar P-ring protein FlgI